MNTREALISVIVPVFNRQNTIRRCLDSIKNQTYKTLEIIVIDDGSIDQSYDICMEYAIKDKRISVLRQINGGVSSARNTGLDHASGDIIVFVDSDDFILPSFFENLLNAFADKTIDIVVARFASGYESGDKYSVSEEVSISGEYNSIDFEKLQYTSKNAYEHGMAMCVWGKGFRKKIFDKIRFKGRFSEDYIFTDEVNSQSYRIKIIDEIGYIYCHNPDSLVRNTSPIERSVFLEILEKRIVLFADDEYIVNNTCKLFCNMYIEYFFAVKKTERPQIEKHKSQFQLCIKTLKVNHVKDWKFYTRMSIFTFSPYIYGQLTSMNKNSST